MRHSLVLAIALTACATCALAESRSSKALDQQVDSLVEQIVAGLAAQKAVKVAVLDFPYLDGRASDLGRFLTEEVTTRLVRTGRFQVVERRLLAKILAEQTLGASGLLDEATAARLGRMLGADTLTAGTVADLGSSVKVNARIIATETGSVMAAATIKLPVEKEVETLLGRRPGVASNDPLRFDGTWEVVIACTGQGGALGYTWRLLASVQDGILHGQFGTEGVAPCLTVDGRISADGTSTLFASGLSGDSKYSTGNNQKGTPYSYHIDATFTEARGSGHRVETRPCDILFVKK